MAEFIHFLHLCAEYINLSELIFKSGIEFGEVEFGILCGKLAMEESDLFIFAALYGAYPLYGPERTLNVIRKAFA